MLSLLIIARVLVYNDTGDKEPDAWRSIAKLLNERMDPASYQEIRVYTGQSAKGWVESLVAKDDVYMIWWTMVKTLVVLTKI